MLEILSLLFPINSTILYSQNTQPIVENYLVKPLPGELNQIPVFNSNSPELVIGEGILLSTFPQDNKNNPQAHLNYGFKGRFDIFTHHVAKAIDENDQRTLYLGILINNPTHNEGTLEILQGASYLSQPDAPFIQLPAQVESRNTYAGPGSRVTGEILQGKRQDIFPGQIQLQPGESKMLLNAPIPVQTLTPKLNGRSTYIRLYSDGLVHVASLAMYRDGENNSPNLSEWEKLLSDAALSTPRDLAPTPPKATGKTIYGRVAGVSYGNLWRSDIVDSPASKVLTIPKLGNTLAHGNYGVQYSLTLPLHNPSQETKTVKLAISTPIKQDIPGVKFFSSPSSAVFFRGLVRIKYHDEDNICSVKYIHLVQKRGEKGEDLMTLEIPPQETKSVSVDFLYPPDATPPQILTVSTR